LKLQSKITIATIGISLISTLSVGGWVLALSYNNGIKQIQRDLSQVIQIVESTQDDAVSTALLAVNGREMTLGYMEIDGNVTLLQDAAGPLSSSNLELKTMGLADGEKLIFAASNKDVTDSTANSLVLALAIAALTSALASLVSWFVLRSDLRNIKRLIEAAGKVANGEKVSFENIKGSSEIVDLSNSLTQMVTKLQDLNRQMQEFLGDASHELKTPLTVIRGYMEILSNRNLTDPQQIERAILNAHKEAIRMQELVSDILTLAELGEIRESAKSPINFEKMFNEVFTDLETQQPERPIVINSNQQSDFIGSEELMIRYMRNVISNIIRYTPPQAEVALNIVQTPVGFDLIVDDAGPGIADLKPNEKIVAFNRFDDSRSRSSGGTGLGLSIMAKIIENHGGALELSTSSLGGLRVSAFLPN
jgi:two-component system OmpR family sensor kinase